VLRLRSTNRRRLTLALLLFCALAAALCSPARATASAGEADPSFGNNGVATLTDRTDHKEDSNAGQLSVSPTTGAIDVAGVSHWNGRQPLVARFTAGGLQDPDITPEAIGGGGGEAFNGYATWTYINAYNAYQNSANFTHIARQTNGQALAAGIFSHYPTSAIIHRTQQNGLSDRDWYFSGNYQWQLSDVAGLHAYPDGRVLLLVNGSNSGVKRFALVMFLADGSLDPAFGGGSSVVQFGPGVADIGHPNGYGDASATSMTTDAQGRPVVAVTLNSIGTPPATALLRLQTDGAPDLTFGDGDGWQTAAPDATAVTTTTTDGSVLTAGTKTNSEGRLVFTLQRYDAAGQPDPDYEPDTVDWGADAALSNVKALPNGGALLVGTANDHAVLSAHRADGTVDTDFGGDGKVQGPEHTSGADVTLDVDNEVFLGGTCTRRRYNPYIALWQDELCVRKYHGSDNWTWGVLTSPTITGVGAVGEELTGSLGTWADAGAYDIEYTSQWQRCAAASCEDINGARQEHLTASQAQQPAHYTLTAADRGHTIRLAVTASSVIGTETAVSLSMTGPSVEAPDNAYSRLVKAQDDLLAYYRLDETQGDELIDSAQTTHLHSGRWYGVPAFGTPGALAVAGNSAVTFGGLSHATIPNFPTPPNLTLETWVKPQPGLQMQMVNRDIGDGSRIWQFRIEADGKPSFIPFDMESQPHELAGTSNLANGSWHHVVATATKEPTDSHTLLALYVDGVQQATGSLDGSIPSSGSSTGVGRASWMTGGSDFVGAMDEVAVYGHGLTPAQVHEHYAAGADEVAERQDGDGDGIPDEWEVTGDLNGDGVMDLDLASMGASPSHKDVFVQLDAMPDDRIGNEAIAKVVAAFADAPVSNLDGESGIALHVDNGAVSIMDPRHDENGVVVSDPRDGSKWGSSLSDARHNVTQSDSIGAWVDVDAQLYDWAEFDSIKRQSLSANRAKVFHYALSANSFGNANSSGMSRGDRDSGGASDLILAIGSRDWGCTGDVLACDDSDTAGTFMHELGHNLGLNHGGDDAVNWKPNYVSVMNYSFQVGEQGGTRPLDYSRYDESDGMMALDEAALSQTAGFGVPLATSWLGLATRFYCGPQDETGRTVLLQASFIDFDCDDETGGTVSADINRDDGISVLRPFDDWSHLVFKGGAVGGMGVGERLPRLTVRSEPTEQEQTGASAPSEATP